jgi:hypothetical protein
VPLELDPPQPEAVARAIEMLLGEHGSAPGAWWTGGIEYDLRRDDGPAAQDAGGRTGIVEP